MSESFLEPARSFAFLLSEAPGTLSRENVMLAAGPAYEAGTVLGQITDGDEYTAVDPDAIDGSASARAILGLAATVRTAAEAVAVVDCCAEVVADLLVWPDGFTAGQIATGLTDLGLFFIKAR